LPNEEESSDATEIQTPSALEKQPKIQTLDNNQLEISLNIQPKKEKNLLSKRQKNQKQPSLMSSISLSSSNEPFPDIPNIDIKTPLSKKKNSSQILTDKDVSNIDQKLDILGFDRESSISKYIKSQIENLIQEKSTNYKSNCLDFINKNFPNANIEDEEKDHIVFNESQTKPTFKDDFINYLNDCILEYDKAFISKQNKSADSNKANDEGISSVLNDIFDTYNNAAKGIGKGILGKTVDSNSMVKDMKNDKDLNDKIVDSLVGMMRDENNKGNSENIWNENIADFEKDILVKKWVKDFIEKNPKLELDENSLKKRIAYLYPRILYQYFKLRGYQPLEIAQIIDKVTNKPSITTS